MFIIQEYSQVFNRVSTGYRELTEFIVMTTTTTIAAAAATTTTTTTTTTCLSKNKK
jgi:hypothetical protein